MFVYSKRKYVKDFLDKQIGEKNFIIQSVNKNKRFIPNNKNTKYPRILKKFKKMLKNAPKVGGDKY